MGRSLFRTVASGRRESRQSFIILRIIGFCKSQRDLNPRLLCLHKRSALSYDFVTHQHVTMIRYIKSCHSRLSREESLIIKYGGRLKSHGCGCRLDKCEWLATVKLCGWCFHWTRGSHMLPVTCALKLSCSVTNVILRSVDLKFCINWLLNLDFIWSAVGPTASIATDDSAGGHGGVKVISDPWPSLLLLWYRTVSVLHFRVPASCTCEVQIIALHMSPSRLFAFSKSTGFRHLQARSVSRGLAVSFRKSTGFRHLQARSVSRQAGTCCSVQ